MKNKLLVKFRGQNSILPEEEKKKEKLIKNFRYVFKDFDGCYSFLKTKMNIRYV